MKSVFLAIANWRKKQTNYWIYCDNDHIYNLFVWEVYVFDADV